MEGRSACGFSWFGLFARQPEFAQEGFDDRKKWIGVDFDGTLAEYQSFRNIKNPGPPVKEMVNRVKEWIGQGTNVKIFTARVCSLQTKDEIEEQRKIIEEWCVLHIGQKLEITSEKDFNMVELWDNRAIGVIENRGIPLRKP